MIDQATMQVNIPGSLPTSLLLYPLSLWKPHKLSFPSVVHFDEGT